VKTLEDKQERGTVMEAKLDAAVRTLDKIGVQLKDRPRRALGFDKIEPFLDVRQAHVDSIEPPVNPGKPFFNSRHPHLQIVNVVHQPVEFEIDPL